MLNNDYKYSSFLHRKLNISFSVFMMLCLMDPSEFYCLLGIPFTPTNSPEVTNIGPNYVDLSWKASESDGGQPVLGYQVERLDSRRRCWLIMNKTPLSDTHFRVENLYGSTPHQFRVKAINSKGLSDPSPTTAPIFCHEKPSMSYFFTYF